MQKIRYQYKYALLFLLTALTVGMIFSSEAFRSELDENYGLKFLTTFSSESIYKIDDRLKIIAFDDISFKNIRYDIMEPSRVEGDPPETGSVREELMQNASECKPDGLENLPFIDQNIYGSDLPLIRWAEFFCLLDKLKPSTIIIDRHWSNLIASKEDSDSFTKLTKNLNARLAIGAVPGDPETKKYFDKKDLVSVFGEQDRDPKVQKSGEIRDVFVVPEKQFLFTSVVHKIRDSFSYIGHILYDKPSRISPLLFDSKGGPVPHLAFSAQEIGVKEKSKIDPISKISEVPLDRNQRIPLLILQRDDLIKRTESLYWMRRYLSAKFATKKGKKHFKIKSGDVVLILPSAFSGGPDYRDSYEGRYPGGFLLASMINSVLTNRWITPINTSKVEYLAVLCFFAFVTLFLSPIQTLISALGFLGVILAVTFTLFWYSLTYLPFLTIGLSLGTLSILIAGFQFFEVNRRLKVFNGNVSKKYSKETIEKVERSPEPLVVKPSRRLSTTLMMDVAGFTQTIRDYSLSPEETVEYLQSSYEYAVGMIEQRGGIVDKIPGDQIVSSWGYYYDGKVKIESHPQAALMFAVWFLRENSKRNQEKKAMGKPQIHWRIGIATGDSLFCMLLKGRFTESTMIGDGPNYAARFESGATPDYINIDKSTLDEISELPSDIKLNPVWFYIKRNEDLGEVFQVDPYHGVHTGTKLERGEIDDRGEKRHVIESSIPVFSLLNDKKSFMIDVSRSGMLLKTDCIYGSMSLMLSIGIRNDEPHEKLYKKNLETLLCEVKWSIATENNHFLTGVEFSQFYSEKVRDDLLEILLKHDQSKDSSR